MTTPVTIYGLMAEFVEPNQILEAARSAQQAGYRDMDAYTPYSVEGLTACLGMKRTRIPSLVFIGGVVGASAGFIMQYYAMAIDYPLNIGGRPYNSWPVYIPVAFELMVLVASFSAVLGMLLLNGLPRLHHPVFNVPSFARASQDRFFLCIEASDALFDREATARFLLSLSPHGPVIEVPLETLSEPEHLEAAGLEATARESAPMIPS
jgi:hypothetical protein